MIVEPDIFTEPVVVVEPDVVKDPVIIVDPDILTLSPSEFFSTPLLSIVTNLVPPPERFFNVTGSEPDTVSEPVIEVAPV